MIRPPFYRAAFFCQLVRQRGRTAEVQIRRLRADAVEDHGAAGDEPILCFAKWQLLQLLQQCGFIEHRNPSFQA